MLTKDDNQLITSVGPGTPTGDLFRQYWIPFLLSSELPEPDCAPQRMRLLGEDLIAYRDTSGRVGMVANACPHRGASMFFGRNEEDGLRCVYHGWKFDLSGACTDMPNEPAESNFKHKIRIAAYPCAEVNGVVWTYMGPRRQPPPMPQLSWTLVPEENTCATKITEDCNWLQVLEGDLDTAHADYLHFVAEGAGGPTGGPLPMHEGGRWALDLAPASVDLLFTEFGFTKAARREASNNRYHYRIYQYLAPFYVLLPAGGDGVSYRAAVPMDDTHTMFWNGKYSPTRPMTDDERRRPGTSGYCEYLPFTTDVFGKWRYATTAENNYLLDYEAQRSKKLFSGIPPVKPQDIAMTESMGPINDRTKEHLGTTDAAIIQMRRCVMNAAKALRTGGVIPPGVDHPEVYAVHSATAMLPREVDWIAATREKLVASPGQAVASAY